MSFETVQSADGTSIAFERAGDGPPLVLVGGAFCDRTAPPSGTPLAALLAPRFTVLSYDRRGRGDSGDGADRSIDRELEDLAAVIVAAGGRPMVFGNSSGGLLAFDAAVRGLPLSRLAFYEPPVVLDPARVQSLEEIAAQLEAAVREERREAAVELYLTRVMQLPGPAFEQLRRSPAFVGMRGLAHTLASDVRLAARGPDRLAEAGAIGVPTLALMGEASPPWMRGAIEALAQRIPAGRSEALAGQSHAVDIAQLAEALHAFLGT